MKLLRNSGKGGGILRIGTVKKLANGGMTNAFNLKFLNKSTFHFIKNNIQPKEFAISHSKIRHYKLIRRRYIRIHSPVHGHVPITPEGTICIPGNIPLTQSFFTSAASLPIPCATAGAINCKRSIAYAEHYTTILEFINTDLNYSKAWYTISTGSWLPKTIFSNWFTRGIVYFECFSEFIFFPETIFHCKWERIVTEYHYNAAIFFRSACSPHSLVEKLLACKCKNSIWMWGIINNLVFFILYLAHPDIRISHITLQELVFPAKPCKGAARLAMPNVAAPAARDPIKPRRPVF
jgi:hypothetical protein